jgi:uncharacterized membrane protein
MLILAYLITVPVVAIVDFLWIGIVMKNFYQDRIGHLFASSFSIPAAVVLYFLMILGIMYFAAYPAYLARSLSSAALSGAALGFFGYGLYDLTNMATLKNWPLSMTLVDMAWGTVLCSLGSIVAYLLLVWLKG